MSTPRLAALLAAAALLALAADHSLGGSSPSVARAATGGGPAAPFIRFTGTGTATVRPDEATIYLSTSGRGASLADATNSASAAMRRVIAAMRRDGVQPADLQTSQASGGHDAHGADPWLARQSLTVTVRQASHTGRLMADAIAAGATATSGPDFSQANQEAGRAQAIARAVANARTEADAAAGAAGLRITGVRSVTESSGAYPLYGAALAAGAKSAVTPVPVQPGSQQVTATVTVTFSVAAA